MTAKCANPSCTERFLYFRTGRIFLIDASGAVSPDNSNSRRTPEYFWLCGECARAMRVVLDRNGEVAIERLENAGLVLWPVEGKSSGNRAQAQTAK